MFFASPEACVASFMFEKRECANAFANAASELNRIVGKGMDKVDCRMRFRLCETQSAAPKRERLDLYVPAMLGVELSKSRKGWRATPIIAVEFPSGLLRPQPISHLAVAPPAPSPAAPAPPPKWLVSVTAAFADQVQIGARAKRSAETKSTGSAR